MRENCAAGENEMKQARASLGHSPEGVAQISLGLSELAKTGNRNTATQLLNRLAEAQALAGATTEALATVEEALIANPEELAWRGDALRVRGGLHLTLWSQGRGGGRHPRSYRACA